MFPELTMGQCEEVCDAISSLVKSEIAA